jgi:hypothetical protein
MSACSIAAARLCAAFKSMATIAFTNLLVASIRRAQLCSNAVGESERLPMSRRASTAERSQGSVMEHCSIGLAA